MTDKILTPPNPPKRIRLNGKVVPTVVFGAEVSEVELEMPWGPQTVERLLVNDHSVDSYTVILADDGWIDVTTDPLL